MMTNPYTHKRRAAPDPMPAVIRKVVIVNGSTATLPMLETLLEAGQYDVVFVESTNHAYSQIKKTMPDLVILCVRVEDLDGFQVLSMLKLDEDTHGIPVLTCAAEFEGTETAAEGPAGPSESEIFSLSGAIRMN